jgi:hypothetical protein
LAATIAIMIVLYLLPAGVRCHVRRSPCFTPLVSVSSSALSLRHFGAVITNVIFFWVAWLAVLTMMRFLSGRGGSWA